MIKLLIGTSLLLIGFAGKSQYRYAKNFTEEFGVSLNGMNCNTDIEGKVADIKNTRLSGGIYGALLYHKLIGLRLEATLGKVTADDKRSNKIVKNRNLNFRSSISEISLLAELHPLNLHFKQDYMPQLSPYILAGVGYFSFNPEAQLNGSWIYLQPLHTEGEGFPETGRPNYKLHNINISIGGGLQYKINERYSLRGEAVYRFLNTDYLDDVSTTYIDQALFDKYLSVSDAALAKQLADRSVELSGDHVHAPGTVRGSQKKDIYYSINIKLSVLLSKGERKSSGCYTF